MEGAEIFNPGIKASEHLLFKYSFIQPADLFWVHFTSDTVTGSGYITEWKLKDKKPCHNQASSLVGEILTVIKIDYLEQRGERTSHMNISGRHSMQRDNKP